MLLTVRKCQQYSPTPVVKYPFSVKSWGSVVHVGPDDDESSRCKTARQHEMAEAVCYRTLRGHRWAALIPFEGGSAHPRSVLVARSSRARNPSEIEGILHEKGLEPQRASVLELTNKKK